MLFYNTYRPVRSCRKLLGSCNISKNHNKSSVDFFELCAWSFVNFFWRPSLSTGNTVLVGKFNYILKLVVVKHLIFVLAATDEGIQFIEQDYCCTVCSTTFGLKCNAMRHMRKFHPNPSDAPKLFETRNKQHSITSAKSRRKHF